MLKLTENLIQQRLKTCTAGLDKVLKINITGRELQDVSLLRKMTGLEILSLSVNNISSLADFQNCKNLRELYLRHNNIRDINEISYLQDLPKLELLMLSENPCTGEPLYRMTVIKNLKHLTELDGVLITPEERINAVKLGKDVFCNSNNEGNQRTRKESPPRLKLPQNNFVEERDINLRVETINEDETVFRPPPPPPPPPPPLAVEKPKEPTKPSEINRTHKHPPAGEKDQPVKKNSKVRCGSAPLEEPHQKSSSCMFCKSPTEVRPIYDAHHLRLIKKNSNLLSATLNLVKELDYSSLQIINAEISSLLNAYHLDHCCQPPE